MKVSIVIAQMLCGGAERVVFNLVQALNQEGIQTQLIVLGRIDLDLFPELSQLNMLEFNFAQKSNALFSNSAKIKFIRHAVTTFSSDIILSFIDATNVLALLATRSLKIPVIISERNHPDHSRMSRIWFYLRKFTYPFANSLVVANQGLKKICTNKKFNQRIDVIPNLMNSKENNYPVERQKKIIAVGSLSSQKRFDVLIDAFSLLFQRNVLQGYQLNIFGEGRLREALQKQIDDHGLQNEIHLKGQSRDIFKEYYSSHIFVLCSDYEGQPNVLLEAMSCGLACIATDCDFGPREIIIPNVNGVLIPTHAVAQLASSLEQLILNDTLQRALGQKAQKTIHTYFSHAAIVAQWIRLFNEVRVKNARHPIALD